ncbi:MAG: hypothetical protein JWL58_3533, partial [Streptosporangiaceae bacterium]|nr:hypothetical protein [Streptosporangiaceae bacterium]
MTVLDPPAAWAGSGVVALTGRADVLVGVLVH